MLVEIIRELTKTKEGSNVPNGQSLFWAKGVEAQSAGCQVPFFPIFFANSYCNDMIII